MVTAGALTELHVPPQQREIAYDTLDFLDKRRKDEQEAKTKRNAPLHENFHRGALQGMRNISDAL